MMKILFFYLLFLHNGFCFASSSPEVGSCDKNGKLSNSKKSLCVVTVWKPCIATSNGDTVGKYRCEMGAGQTTGKWRERGITETVIAETTGNNVLAKKTAKPIGDAGKKAKDTGKSVMKKAKDGAKDTANKAKKGAKDATNKVKDGAKDTANKAKDTGKSVMKKIKKKF